MSDLSQVAVYSDSSDIYKVSEDDDGGAVLLVKELLGCSADICSSLT